MSNINLFISLSCGYLYLTNVSLIFFFFFFFCQIVIFVFVHWIFVLRDFRHHSREKRFYVMLELWPNKVSLADNSNNNISKHTYHSTTYAPITYYYARPSLSLSISAYLPLSLITTFKSPWTILSIKSLYIYDIYWVFLCIFIIFSCRHTFVN